MELKVHYHALFKMFLIILMNKPDIGKTGTLWS